MKYINKVGPEEKATKTKIGSSKFTSYAVHPLLGDTFSLTQPFQKYSRDIFAGSNKCWRITAQAAGGNELAQ